MVCEKGGRKTKSSGGGFVVESKTSSDCEKNSMNVDLTLVVFGNIYFLVF